MFFKLKPDRLVYKYTDITPQMIQELGGKAVFVDLDGTLVSKDVKEPTQEVIEWVRAIKEAGIDFLILSNNTELRVHNFCKKLGVKYFAEARKPLLKTYRKAYGATVAKVQKHQVVMIGDQIYTDTLGAKRFGAKSIYVDPIDKNSLYVKFRLSFSEKPFVKNLRRQPD